MTLYFSTICKVHVSMSGTGTSGIHIVFDLAHIKLSLEIFKVICILLELHWMHYNVTGFWTIVASTCGKWDFITK